MEKELWNATEDILMELGVRTDLIGFKYICEAVQVISSEQTAIKAYATYSIVGEKLGVSRGSVEGGIRHIVSSLGCDDIERVFGVNYSFTNGSFLGALTIKARRKVLG